MFVAITLGFSDVIYVLSISKIKLVTSQSKTIAFMPSFRMTSSGESDTENKKERIKKEEKVLIGSKEYYKGFLERPLHDESSTRGDGIDQALKLGSGVVVILTLLVALFLFSNGIL